MVVRFSDTANSINDGSSVNNNSNNNNNSNYTNKDDHGIDMLGSSKISNGNGNGNEEETGQRSENAIINVKRKKRLPVTPHPANPNGNAKKRNPTDNIHAQTDACIAEEVESPNATMMTNASRHFEPSSSNGDKTMNDGDQNEEVGINIASKNRNQQDEERQEINDNNEIGIKSNNIVDDKNEEGEEGEEEDMEVEDIDGSNDNDNDNDDPNKRWTDFVNSVDAKTTPNLELYLKAKAIRIEKAEQFANAIDACIQSLRDTTNEIISDVIEPVCNQYTERLDNTQRSIVKTLVSNHSRRNKLTKLMEDADMAWSSRYEKLTADIWNEEEDEVQEEDMVTEKDGNKPTGKNGTNLMAPRDQEELNLTNKDSGENLGNIKDKTQAADEGMYRSKNSIYGCEGSDLDELLDYEPTREKILPFMNERVKRNETMRNFGTVIDDVHADLESEVESILQIASNLYVQHKDMCEDMEYDIESYMMENNGRRSDLQRELENSAQKAQRLFGSLLSRLGQSV
mmetsp:Transcript_50732/g.56674  ORF Transcript_50732/g.56674 Transcript_50732/m.56674 type:complete len:513 (+) Transcript_50732:28-1566(+)